MEFNDKVQSFRDNHAILGKIPLLAKLVVAVGILLGKIITVFSRKKGLPENVKNVDDLALSKLNQPTKTNIADTKLNVTQEPPGNVDKVPLPLQMSHTDDLESKQKESPLVEPPASDAKSPIPKSQPIVPDNSGVSVQTTTTTEASNVKLETKAPLIPKSDKDLTESEKLELDQFKEGFRSFAEKGQSCVYVDVPFRLNKNDKELSPPGWYSQDQISTSAGHSDPKTRIAAEKQLAVLKGKNEPQDKEPFCFATSFGNARDHIPGKEPSILMPNPFSEFAHAEPIEFPNVEFYFHFMKWMIFYHKNDPKASKESLIQEMNNPVYSNFKFFQKEGEQFVVKGSDGPAQAQGFGRLAPFGKIDEKNMANSCAEWRFFAKYRVDIMTSAIYAKFAQNPLLREKLIATENMTLAQLKTDPIWGPLGLNYLGVALDRVRTALRENKPIEPFDIKGKMIEEGLIKE